MILTIISLLFLIVAIACVMDIQNKKLKDLVLTVLANDREASNNYDGLLSRVDVIKITGSRGRADLRHALEITSRMLTEESKKRANLEQDSDVASTERLELEESINEFKRHANESMRNLADRLHVLVQEDSSINISPLTVRYFVEASLALKVLEEDRS